MKKDKNNTERGHAMFPSGYFGGDIITPEISRKIAEFEGIQLKEAASLSESKRREAEQRIIDSLSAEHAAELKHTLEERDKILQDSSKHENTTTENVEESDSEIEQTLDKESYIIITCEDTADPDSNRLFLNTDKMLEITPGLKTPYFIKLQPGKNILRVSEYPELKYGFHNQTCDENDCEFDAPVDSFNDELYFIEASDNCQDIKEIDLKHFDGSEMTTMDNMFLYMYHLERIFLRGLDTSNVRSMSRTFVGVGDNVEGDSEADFYKTLKKAEEEPGFYIKFGIHHFNLSNLNVENVLDFSELFAYSGTFVSNYQTSPVYNLSLSGWKIRHKKAVKGMLDGVDFVLWISLVGCDTVTTDLIAEEWLDYMNHKIIVG